jgi:hypothetical protein
MLERAAPARLLEAKVLDAFAANRGIPSSLRQEVERDKKLADGTKGAIALSRTRAALAYSSRPDAEVVAGWDAPKKEIDQLRVAVAKALVGPVTAPPKPGDPQATKPQSGLELKHLDALAKKPGGVGAAAAFDAALLALEGAQTLPPGDDPTTFVDEQKKAYEAAIARLDAVATRKGLDPARAKQAKELADGARASLKLLERPPQAAPKASTLQTPNKP